jgi:hypothetical protein
MDDCGHRCCRIPGNAYHSHPNPPESCPHCHVGDNSRPVPVPAPEPVTDPREDVDRMSRDLARITATVTSKFAPEIPGLPGGTGLEAVVGPLTMVAYLEAIDDPVLAGVPPAEWRTVVAGRVALSLAFRSALPARF